MTRVALIFGGKSPEHEVSIVSARNVHKNLLAGGFEVVPVGIDRTGTWHVGDSSFDILSGTVQVDGPVCSPLTQIAQLKADVVFPIVHGVNGEDGMLAGFCQMAGLPYVGGDLLNGSLCWDKLTTRGLLAANDIPQLPFQAFFRDDFQADQAVTAIEARFSYPVFVKPSRTGSSIGISRATDRASLTAAMTFAFEYDYRLIVEPGLNGAMEVELSGLGAMTPTLSEAVHIIPEQPFYDFEHKYIKDNTRFEIPAKLSDEQRTKMTDIAIRAWRLLNCYGMARIDFLVTPDEVYLNEINTCPGFTAISMYPHLLERMGIEPPSLMKRLVELALDREKLAGTRTNFKGNADWWKQ